MRKLFFLTVVAGALLLHPVNLPAVSFDCSKNVGPVERAVCSDRRLSELDDRLAEAYRNALANSADRNGVKADQVKWLRSDRDRCRDTTCIEAAYMRRLSQLQTNAAQAGPASPSGSGTPGKSPATLQDRAAWRAILKWPAECENTFRDYARDKAGSGLKFHPLGGQRYLVEIECDRGAYQYVFMYMLFDEGTSSAKLLKLKQYDLQADGSATVAEEEDVAGLPEFDEKNKTLKIFSKARGLGDCGSLVTYGFGEGAANVIEARARACSDTVPKAGTNPESWKKLK